MNQANEELIARIETMMAEEGEIRATAEGLREAVIDSLATQVKLWQRSAIALMIAFVVLVVGSLGIFLVLLELRESQETIKQSHEDLTTLVEFEEGARDEETAARNKAISDAVASIFRLERAICALQEVHCEGEEGE